MELTPRQLKIIVLIEQSREIQTKDIAKEFKVSYMTIYKDIRHLKESGIVERIGAAKNGWWRLVSREACTTEEISLSIRQSNVIDLIKQNREIQIKDIAKELDCCNMTIALDLRHLKELGKIERIGSNINGYWKLADHNTNQLSSRQYKIITLIDCNCSITIKDIAKQLKIHKITATSELCRLREQGLLEKNGLGPRQLKIISLIKQDQKISIRDMAKKMNIATMTVLSDLRHLKKLGRVQRIGARKNGYWISIP